jgi:S-adenosylmethionine-diacylglycerol 3-amino-3-carboxypropyl transferase
MAVCRYLPEWIGEYWSAHASRFERSLHLRGLTASMLAQLRRRARIAIDWARALVVLPPQQRVEALYEALAPLDTRWFRGALSTPMSLVALGINFTQRDRLVGAEHAPSMADLFVAHLTKVMHTDIATNWFFWWAAAGQFDHHNAEAVPPYLRRSRFERSQGAPTTLRFRHGNVFDTLAEAGPNRWSHYTLCDAVDWMAPEVQQRLFREIRRTGRPGALVLMRSVEDDDPVTSAGATDWLQKLPVSSQATLADRSRQYRQANLYRLSA